MLRTNDYPIDPPGGRAYLLKGVEAELFEQFKQTCAAQQRSMRWVLLSLMHEYVKGTVKT